MNKPSEPFIVATVSWDYKESLSKYKLAMAKAIAKYGLTFNIEDNFLSDTYWIVGANQTLTYEEISALRCSSHSENGKHLNRSSALVSVVSYASKEAALADCKEIMEC